MAARSRAAKHVEIRPRAVLTLFGLLVWTFLAPAPASSQEYSEYEIKAGYLLNFTRYVEWPQNTFADAETPLVIGILGADPFGEQVDAIVAKRTSNGRRVEIRRFQEVAEASGSQVIFISREERRRQAELLEQLDGQQVLTVGESDRFLQDGGCINLVLSRSGASSRVLFEVNLDAAEAAGLKISSRMLSLAKEVVRSKGKKRKS